MKIFTSRPVIALASAAALSMTATPALADGWRHYRHHHDGLDAGDVFAGLLVIGGIAAIASAASNSNKKRREDEYRYPDSRYPDRDYREPEYRAPSSGYRDYPEQRDSREMYRSSSSYIGEAVDRCIDEIERGDRRVDGVDSVWRDGEGWRVDGRVDDGRDFSCAIDRDGRIRKATVAG